MLGNLRELDISNCGHIVRIPETIGNLRTLEILYVDENTILPYSVNILSPRLKIILK